MNFFDGGFGIYWADRRNEDMGLKKVTFLRSAIKARSMRRVSLKEESKDTDRKCIAIVGARTQAPAIAC
jgi:hypothetical protein